MAGFEDRYYLRLISTSVLPGAAFNFTLWIAQRGLRNSVDFYFVKFLQLMLWLITLPFSCKEILTCYSKI
jgi:hypothetical protein